MGNEPTRLDSPSTHEDIVLECRGVSHWFGPKRVLHDVNVGVMHGEIVGLVGPSGCGKSTLLRAVVGTHPPRRGCVLMRTPNGDAVPVRQPGRDRGIVYQHYSLYPFLTAQQNVAVGLMLDQTSIPFRLLRFPKWRQIRKQHLSEAAAFLERLGLGDAIKRYPSELSGGMRQRVAIAQALIMKPRVLLLDEPFGALDEATREDLQRLLLTLYLENCQQKQRGLPPPYTILIVTHELNEAIFVGDRVVGLSQYWDWRRDGFTEPPGATVVYDQTAPVFRPEDERDFARLRDQREQVRRAVFDPSYCQERDQFRTFWDQVNSGKGQGVLE
ncbi:MAG: ATP-binding cassette domain-containing protein [bacterium]|nr:ATP-binding cassette domain-containing protein [bacterium]